MMISMKMISSLVNRMKTSQWQFRSVCNHSGNFMEKIKQPKISVICTALNPMPVTLVMWELTTNGRARWAWTRESCSYRCCNRYHSWGWNRGGLPVDTGADWLIYDDNKTFSVSTEMKYSFHSKHIMSRTGKMQACWVFIFNICISNKI